MRLRLTLLVILSGSLVLVGRSSAQTTSATDPKPGAAADASRGRQGMGRGPGAGRGSGQGADGVGLAELQRLFDAYFMLQAQDALKLDEAQFAPFLTRLKALQETRRRNEQARVELVAGLARLTGPGQPIDETLVKEKLRALQEADGRAAAELRKAYEALDQVLDIERQARFRVFEQNMERRKFELMLRARRAEAGRVAPGKRP
ncbi:MAG: hypothetical protein NTY02_16550 [Acidobacteria bacterium]|nr:hypothetical protein [Acidobacteriota bacterium]